MDWSTMFTSRVVVFGCGNVLFGDDGVGPVLIQELENDPDIPGDVALLDVGTSIRNLLFDLLLSDSLPKRIVVVDATTDENRTPGEIWEIDVDHIHPKKISDFSMHQFPSTNLLKEIKEKTGVEMKIVVVQAGWIPEEFAEGLSEPVRAALPELKRRVKQLIAEGSQ
jgi:coenzyme F420 hydrogenase subunit delta